jgi:hypothetical protein
MPDSTTGSVQVDASVNEQHITTAQVTEHPVESGPNVTDYIRPMPRKLTLELMISNTPTYLPSTQMRGAQANPAARTSVLVGNNPTAFSSLKFSDDFDRVRDAYTDLVDAILAGALFQITTTLTNYDHMACINLSAPRNAESGNAIKFAIDFQEVRIVDTQDVKTPAAKHKPKNRGRKPTKPKDGHENDKMKSTAASFVDSVQKFISGTP